MSNELPDFYGNSPTLVETGCACSNSHYLSWVDNLQNLMALVRINHENILFAMIIIGIIVS